MKEQVGRIWFDGSDTVKCNLETLEQNLLNIGSHFEAIVSRMPGLSSVKLIDQGVDWVKIETNEGLMMRTGIIKEIVSNQITLEFDEVYRAGSMVTTEAHFKHEFSSSDGKITHNLIITTLKTTGFLGFFYRLFGKSSTGQAFLKAYKEYLENQDT